MPHEGYADPVANDRPGFHLDIPLESSLSTSLEPSRQATLAQPLRLRENTDGVTHKTQPAPTKPNRV